MARRAFNNGGMEEKKVFRYERDMQFSIEIFDSSACKRTKFPDVRTHRGQGRAKKCDNNSAAGIHIRSCQSNKVKEVKEEEAATLPNLEFPAFTSFIGQGLYNVAVPTEFSINYLPRGYYPVILKNSEGREWKVSIVPSVNTVKLSGGWAAFRRDNQINSGDICTFELVRRETMVVHIVHM
ncbi:hypothetical protein M0R45_001814 [Rubus argutus]|uniref:TF-B3 domain-containing protein n=1 Tax=Rubus argutus TaxID=59490 RepID=A0AAW1VIL3_RUBAR